MYNIPSYRFDMLLARLQPIFDQEHEQNNEQNKKPHISLSFGPSSVKRQQYVMRYSYLDDEQTFPSYCLIRGLFVILANIKGAWTTVTLKYQP